LSQLPLGLGKSKSGGESRGAVRVGYVDGALGSEDAVGSLAALFPQARFQSVGAVWPERGQSACDILVVEIDAGSAESAAARIKATSGAQIVVVLHNANLAASRLLTREGAADVLPAPVNETTLALCLERLLERTGGDTTEAKGKSGEIVAFIKAGGGVGATSLITQSAIMLARRGAENVCLVDLDLQFGAAGAYLDLLDAFSLLDVLALGQTMNQAELGSILAEHRSGVRLIGAPKEMSPVDVIRPAQVDSLVALLRRSYSLSLLDLPSVWTTWALRAVAGADRIVLVGHLTVASVQLISRQLRFLEAQKLTDRPITLVCNACSPEQMASVPLKAAEKSIGRPFDVVTPEDTKLMLSAVNQGVPLDEIRRGTKLEKAIGQVADQIREPTASVTTARRWF